MCLVVNAKLFLVFLVFTVVDGNYPSNFRISICCSGGPVFILDEQRPKRLIFCHIAAPLRLDTSDLLRRERTSFTTVSDACEMVEAARIGVNKRVVS